MSREFIYFFKQELNFRLHTSSIIWCYYCLSFVTSCVIVGAVTFPRQPMVNFVKTFHLPAFNFYPSTILSVILFILFFISNFDIFLRETELNLRDFFIMKSCNLSTFYNARIRANALLMILPNLLSYLIMASMQLIPLILFNLHDISNFVSLILIFLLLYFWFLFCLIIQILLEMSCQDRLYRAVLQFGSTLFIIVLLKIMSIIVPESNLIIGVILGIELLNNDVLSIIVLSLCIIGVEICIWKLLRKRLKDLYNVQESSNSHMILTKVQKMLKKFIQTTNKLFTMQKLWIAVTSMTFVLISLFITALEDRLSVLVYLYAIFFFSILLYLLIGAYPHIVAEKQFNLEELLLSRISSYSYFKAKFNFLLSKSFSFLFIPSLILLGNIFLMPDGVIRASLLIIFVLLHLIYVISILLFIWRLLAVQNIIKTSLLGVCAIDLIIGIYVVFFVPEFITALSLQGVDFSEIGFVYRVAQIVFSSIPLSPFISIFTLPECIFYPRAFDSTIIGYLLTPFVLLLAISLTLLFASYIYIKVSIRYE